LKPNGYVSPGNTTPSSGATLPEQAEAGPPGVDAALAYALRESTRAGQWVLVAALLDELRARRLTRGGQP